MFSLSLISTGFGLNFPLFYSTYISYFEIIASFDRLHSMELKFSGVLLGIISKSLAIRFKKFNESDLIKFE